MSPGIGKYNQIRHIVRIRQMLRRWRKKAAAAAAGSSRSDVPAGHVAICVGRSNKRFVVRATYLNHPTFKNLLVQAEEEYGFTNQGPLVLPCDESVFEEILRVVSLSDSGNSANSGRFVNLDDFQRCCDVGRRSNLDGLGESGPLLHGLGDESVC